MAYPFEQIESKWQKFWKENNTYKVEDDFSKPKYFVLDMFPYPSGAGLHIGPSRRLYRNRYNKPDIKR